MPSSACATRHARRRPSGHRPCPAGRRRPRRREPISEWPKRLPSSSVQLTSSSGASVTIAEIVQGAHDLEPRDARRARRRTCRRTAGCRGGCRTAPARASGRGPRGGRTCCRWHRRARVRPSASHQSREAVAGLRGPPRSGSAGARRPSAWRRSSAMAIRLSHRRRASIRWLVLSVIPSFSLMPMPR